MKKVLFTAIAMVAFSSVSMAEINTDGKIFKAVTKIEAEKMILQRDNPICDSIAWDTYGTWYGNGFSDEYARAKATAAKNDCLRDFSGPEGPDGN